MNEYMSSRLQLADTEVSELRRHYYETYGTTLRGLQLHHGVDTDDFLAYVHDLPLEKFIQPIPEMTELLNSLPQQIYIFTNADQQHAERVLKQLQIRAIISGIIDIRAIDFNSKPNPEAYRRALSLVGQPAPNQVLLIDDSLRNLEQGRQLGWNTIWVTPSTQLAGEHLQLSSMTQLKQVMPDLWPVSTN